MMDAEGVPIWYVFNESDMCSPEQPERLYIKTVDMNHLIAYVPEDAGTCKDVCASVSEFTCSECGFNCDLTSWISLFDGDDGRHCHHHHGTPNFCPNCGRRTKEEAE